MESLDLRDIPAGALLLIDSAPIIFLLENRAGFVDRYRPLLEAHADGRVHFAVSTITLMEVMAGPLAKRQEAMAERYRAVLESWHVVPLDADIAARAAHIRAVQGLRSPDAVQVASAIAVHAHALVTHDRDFSKVAGIRVLTG